MTKRWSSTASGDGQTKREASKAARQEPVEIVSLCMDCGGLVSDDGYSIDPDKCCFRCQP
jgi:hypothetical protein